MLGNGREFRVRKFRFCQVSNTYRAAADQRAQAEKLKEFTVAERTARQAEFARMYSFYVIIQSQSAIIIFGRFAENCSNL